MELPDLERIVETHLHVATGDINGYLLRLRTDVLPAIRGLQDGTQLRWYSFLLHTAKQVLGHTPDDETWVIHLRLEPPGDLGVDEFIASLPPAFESPVLRPLSAISGLDPSILAEQNWSRAWRIAGVSSEWVLCLLEAYPSDPPVEQVAQYLHYVSNPLGLGGQGMLAGPRF